MNVQELKDVVYGPRERNRLDAYLVRKGPGAAPSPALVFFHGGGYLHGDKSQDGASWLRKECLEAGISYISCNYTFISEKPYPAPMHDGTRALQFVRYMAAEWGLHADRIASAGVSAGGHIALWNALKGDASNPASDDPVERTSSAVCAFVGIATQVSKDQRFYEPVYDGPHIQPNIALFYGLSSIDELYRPEALELAREASAITYMSPSAPPAFMAYDIALDGPRIPADMPVGEVIHHPVHGYVLQQEYEKYGIPFTLRHKGNPPKPGEIMRFLLDRLADK